jgi:two-component system, cell cycle response regulator
VADETRRIMLPTTRLGRRWPHLVIVEGEGLGEVFRLLDPETIIGRAPGVDICLASDSVSRQHARLTIAGDQVLVEDLGSRNGTYVDMDIVKGTQPLKAGAHLAIGWSTLFRLTHALALDTAVRKTDFERSTRDPATLVANTHYFLDRLRGDYAYALRHHEPLTLVFLQVDGMRSGSNARDRDTPEIEAPETDAVMRRVAAVLRPMLRAEDLLARSGNETFVVLLRSNGRQATEMAERVRSSVADGSGATNAGHHRQTLSAVVVPVATSAAAAPETVLVAATEVSNAALGDAKDRVVLVPMLSVEGILDSPDKEGAK